MKRYGMLDEIRGATLVSMILYHMIWDMVYLFGRNFPWYTGTLGYIWQQSICWMFILLSGFCFPLGQKRLRRGITVLAAGMAVTVVTYLAMWESRVICGVLTCLGSCMLVMIPADPVLKKIPPFAGMIGSILLFLLCRNINEGSLGFAGIEVAAVPAMLYQNMATAYVGFPARGFFSTDYFSLIPWIFLFIAGYYLYGIVKEQDGFAWMERRTCLRGLEWMGRHSLWIYLMHQPVVMVVLSLLF